MCNPVSTAHPELLLAKGTREGYEWEVTSNGIGYRCGYVRIPPGHPWHGRDYDSIEPYPDVHGGLTFAGADTECDKDGEDNAWWLGFDCAHAGDAPDPSLPTRDGRPLTSLLHAYPGDVIRSTRFVEWQCAGLIDQARLATPHIGDTRACPDCGRPQHYTGTEYGWAHDALIDTWECNDPRKDRA